jgi:MFS family permease
MVVVAALDVLVVILALEVWGSGDAGAGLAAATLGVGSIVGGAIAVVMITRTRLLPSVLAGAVIRSGAMIGLAFSSGPLALVLVATAGVGFSVIDVASRTLLQKTSLPDALAHAFGLFESLQVMGYALGTFAVPLIADALGMRTALIAVAVAFPLGLVARLGALSKLEDSAIASADEVRLIRSSLLLGALPPSSQERLAHRGTWMNLGAGEVFISEGESSNDVYLIGDGTMEVSRNGDRIAVLGQGEVVGEIAALRNVARTATVRALTDVRALRFAGQRFVEAVRGEGTGWSDADQLAEKRRRESGEGD